MVLVRASSIGEIMIASVSTYLTTVQPEVTSATVKSEPAPTSVQAPQPAQNDKPATSQVSSKDTVDLSSNALDLSKALNEQNNAKGAVQNQPLRQNAPPVLEKNPYEAPSKSYPPFMGNAEALKALKETSPQLYREILKMIVPPPLDLSYSDLQMLRSSGNGGNSSRQG